MIRHRTVIKYERAKFADMAIDKAMDGALEMVSNHIDEINVISIESRQHVDKVDSEYAARVELSVFYRG